MSFAEPTEEDREQDLEAGIPLEEEEVVVGERIEQSSSDQNLEKQEDSQDNEEEEEKPRSLTWLFVLLGIILPLLILAGIFAYVKTREDPQETLLEAVRKPDVLLLKTLLEREKNRPDVDYVYQSIYPNYSGPVLWIAGEQTAAVLIENKANINMPVGSGMMTALHFAVYIDDEAKISLFLKNKANPDSKNADGQTALMIACKLRNVKAARLLIPATNVSLKDNDGNTALHLCLRSTYVGIDKNIDDIISDLIEKSPESVMEPDSEGHTPFYLSFTEPNGCKYVPLLAKSKHVTVKNLMEAYSATRLHDSCRRNIKGVLTSRIGTVQKELIEAIKAKNHQLVEKVLNENPEIQVDYPYENDEWGMRFDGTALFVADATVSDILVRKGASVSYKNLTDGRSPIHYAAISNDVKKVGILLGKGANLNAKDASSSMTPLMLAAESGSIDVIRYLLALAGVDFLALNRAGQNALHRLAYAYHGRKEQEDVNVAIAKLLIDKLGSQGLNQCDYASKYIAGYTPFVLAMNSKNCSVAAAFALSMGLSDLKAQLDNMKKYQCYPVVIAALKSGATEQAELASKLESSPT